MYDDSNSPIPIFTINPAPAVEPNDEHEDSEDDDDEDYDGDNEKIEELEPPEEDTSDPISIVSDDKGND